MPLFIAVTAYINADITFRCQEAGFDDQSNGSIITNLVESPLTKEKIQEKILRRLAKRHRPDSDDVSRMPDEEYLYDDEEFSRVGVEENNAEDEES